MKLLLSVLLLSGCVSPCAGMSGARYDACYDRQVRDLHNQLQSVGKQPSYSQPDYQPRTPVICTPLSGGGVMCN